MLSFSSAKTIGDVHLVLARSMTSSSTILTISFNLNLHALNLARYGGAKVNEGVSLGNNWIKCWAAMIQPRWPSHKD